MIGQYLLESQKKIFLIEREAMDKQIADLERLKSEKEAMVSELNHSINKARSTLESIMEQSGITKKVTKD